MAYFPNGTSGDIFEDKWCSRCIHKEGKSGKGCAVMLAHLMHNYEECNNPDSILHVLIPLTETGNGECEMFVETKPK